MTVAELLEHATSPLIAAALAAIAYLVKFYFGKIQEDIQSLRSSLDKHDGRSEALHREIRENTMAMVKLQTEVNAMWHFVDNSKQRATDLGPRR